MVLVLTSKGSPGWGEDKAEAGDNMLFMHVITWLLMQINALIITILCMLSSFKHISIILCKFML